DLKVLRDTSEDLSVKAIESELYAVLAKRLVETVTHPLVDGVGLAAPQIGINRRVVAVQRFDKEGEPFEVYPNISIIETSEELAPGPEGYLSVPNQRHEVMRHTWVTIQYYSLEAHKVVQERIEGFTAVIFQHEVDHLSGVLYIDRVGQ
ncbi:MAG: peptide deformylase, partial [Bacteroidales bacterium]|nr:peptide deformylase [Bacteroidales bacterium]